MASKWLQNQTRKHDHTLTHTYTPTPTDTYRHTHVGGMRTGSQTSRQTAKRAHTRTHVRRRTIQRISVSHCLGIVRLRVNSVMSCVMSSVAIVNIIDWSGVHRLCFCSSRLSLAQIRRCTSPSQSVYVYFCRCLRLFV